jgi:hypothetical protein
MQKAIESKHLEDIRANGKTSKSSLTGPVVLNPKSDSKMQIDEEKQYVTDSTFYLDRENQVLIQNYGPDLYEYAKELEGFQIPKDYLKRHKIDPHTRTKMVDWIVEVLYAYNSDQPTFFLAIHIMDTFLAKSKLVLSSNDIHLVGIVSLFIASKMEDLIPLRMYNVKQKIAHNKFTDKEIKRQERLMLDTINFDIVTSSSYDFIKTFIFDFCHNNKEYITKLELNWIIDLFDSTAIYLAKLMTHSEEFSHHK